MPSIICVVCVPAIYAFGMLRAKSVLWFVCLWQPVLDFDVQQVGLIDLIYQQAQELLNPQVESSRRPPTNPRQQDRRGANVARPHTAHSSRRSSKAQRSARRTRPKTAGRKRLTKRNPTASHLGVETKVDAARTLPASKPRARPSMRKGNSSNGASFPKTFYSCVYICWSYWHRHVHGQHGQPTPTCRGQGNKDGEGASVETDGGVQRLLHIHIHI